MSQMNSRRSVVVILTAALSFLALVSGQITAEESHWDASIDQRSLHIGEIAAFAELVNVGVKKLAFSDVLLPKDTDALLKEATRIANENSVKLYREPELLVSDLFPADVAKGKEVLLIYKGTTLEEYLALKREKAQLVKSGQYTGKAREEIARKLGRLLSYPESGIDMLLKKTTVRE
jgi:hypothetical protein